VALLWASGDDRRMQVGLHALGIGAGARRDVIDAVAAAAENCGFATLWSGEHVVMVDTSSSRYPYSGDGQIAVPPSADWNDPIVGLSFAAAASSTIGIATGVLLLPEHNPVLLAKQVATLDALCGGRLVLGVGIGWSREEFDALGVPFARRAARTAEAAALRTLWREDVASFDGEFVRFDSIRVNPKPVRDRRIPIVLGGNSDPALCRVAAWGDGWYGFNLDGVAAVAERLGYLEARCREVGRDVAGLRRAVALRQPQIRDVPALADLGVDELVIVDSPPADPRLVPDWVSKLAERWSALL
jgi:probable F420-dependent oxidoreductase